MMIDANARDIRLPLMAMIPMRKAGATAPQFNADDLAYTREALAPYLSHTDQPTLIAALFGDAAARQLGYPPLGRSARAGLAPALESGRATP